MALWLAVAVALAMFVTVYATWTAGRLDRMHARVDAARAALDAQLRVRAEAAGAYAANAPGGHPELARAADAARDVAGLDRDREAVENALSRALQDVAGAARADRELATLHDACTRASFTRRFHNDAVRDALVVRRRLVVRLLHLAGHAPRPAYFEIDDAPLVISDVAAAAAPYD